MIFLLENSNPHITASFKPNQDLKTNDDANQGKVLYCQECNYQTPNLKASKSKQKLNAHVYSWHNKEDLPKAKLEAAENNPEEDCNNLPMVQSVAQDKIKEVLHDILEITKAGTESYNET